jgi:hypothetical protein
MTESNSSDPTKGGSALHYLHRGCLAISLVAMIVAFAMLGTLSYQVWKLFHNPYKVPATRVAAPSLEAALWAAEVYRQEKHDHMIFTAGLEVAFIALSAGSWFAYRRLDRHLKETHQAQNPKPERPRRSRVETAPPSNGSKS